MAAIKGLYGSVDEFLEQCKQSGDSAYTALRSLLERLEDPNTRTEARIFFAGLQKRFQSKESIDECLDNYHFRIQDIFIEQHQEGHLFRPLLVYLLILFVCIIYYGFMSFGWLCETPFREFVKNVDFTGTSRCVYMCL